jgi:hypothetical protein
MIYVTNITLDLSKGMCTSPCASKFHDNLRLVHCQIGSHFFLSQV